MTDVVALAKQLYDRLEWQNVPEEVTQDDLTDLIADAIRYLYVITGRALMFSEDMFTVDDGMYTSFSETLELDEKLYVLATAEIALLRRIQNGVDDLTSYSTDAMAVTHGDKPFANLQQKITDAEANREKIWYKMIRFHLL